jgi:hypothetical protein
MPGICRRIESEIDLLEFMVVFPHIGVPLPSLFLARPAAASASVHAPADR